MVDTILSWVGIILTGVGLIVGIIGIILHFRSQKVNENYKREVLSTLSSVIQLTPNDKEEPELLTQADMNRYAYGKYMRVNAEMENIYFEILQSLPKELKKNFQRFHKLWKNFVEKFADFITREEVNGGSMAPVVYYGLLEEVIKIYINELKKLKECLDDLKKYKEKFEE